MLPQIDLAEIVGSASRVQLEMPSFQNGNVSVQELLAIAALVSARKPKICLEIGTFDGNSTLQIAANADGDAKVYTLDLPLQQMELPADLAAADGQFVQAAARSKRRFKGTPFEKNIVEIFGDSMLYDFKTALPPAALDFAFIDGSHSYEYIKSDSEKIFPLMSGNGMVVWHDYNRNWPGVVRYLNDLGKEKTLLNISGTSLVFTGSAA